MKAASNNLFLQQCTCFIQLPYPQYTIQKKIQYSTSTSWVKNRTSSSSPKFNRGKKETSPVTMAGTSQFPIRSSAVIPARDRVIDFGKHKGNMLGTLPSAYLKWVSQNLRAGDTLEWAQLADEVLNDAVYKDRIEWEFAQKLLTGDSPVGTGNDSVAGLLELSQRFGWDNEDRAAWKRIDFALLGTSKGGRIPRLDHNRKPADSRLKKENGSSIKKPITDSGKRRERIERSRLKRDGLNSPGSEKTMAAEKSADNTTNDDDDDSTVEVDPRSRFPGRASLVKKALNLRNNFLS